MLEGMHITKMEALLAPREVFTVHRALVLVDIVGPHHTPAGLFQAEPHEADAGEEFCYSALSFH